MELHFIILGLSANPHRNYGERLYSGASNPNEENVLFFSAAAVKAAVWLPIPPPYGFTQLGGLIIDSLMTSHVLSEPVNVKKKNQKQKKQKLTNKNKKKSSSRVKARSCVINRSFLSITDCQLPPSFEDQRASWRTHRPQTHGRGLMWPTPRNALVCVLCGCACARRPCSEAFL